MPTSCRESIDKEKKIMNTTEQQTITFDNPPIDEIICGIVFDSIKGLQAGHLGMLWQKFKPDFPVIQDQNLLSPISEEDLENRDAPPLPRVWLVHKDENELIQMQFNRFMYNWRKRQPDDRYPGYSTFMANFEKYLYHFQDFLNEEKLGNVAPRHYELTYIDDILEKEGWETITDLGEVFPGLISLKGHKALPPDIREFSWQMLFGLPNDSGRLQLSIRNARLISGDKSHLLRVEFRAVSSEPCQPIRDWFNLAHDVIYDLFLNLINEEIQTQFWGKNYD
jgi:uncharacterized protein (TIGR04255 family)